MSGIQHDYRHGVVQYFGREKTCPLCGKEFLADEVWVYKRRSGRSGNYLYFCSYGHVRKYDADHEKPKSGRRPCEKREEIYDLLDRGWSERSIAAKIGVNLTTVHYYRERWIENKEELEDKDSE